MSIKKIGMRNIKTAISVVICIVIFKIVNREYVLFASIAAIIAMQSSVADSFKTGKNRMLGTVVGALAGMVFAFISPGNTILCGIGIVFIIYICDYLKWQKAIVISCIVFLTVILNLNGKSPMLYSINRVIDTFIGIGVAVLVNYFISPPKYTDKINSEYRLTLDKIFHIVEDKFCYNKNVDLNNLNSEMKKLEDALNLYLSEFRINQQKSEQIEKIKNVLEIFKKIYIHIKVINCFEDGYSVDKVNAIKLKKIFDCSLETEEIQSNLNIVFNYHMSKILDGLTVLKAYSKNN